MSHPPLLDTHVWVWWMLGDPRLSASEREALDTLRPETRPHLCDISVWEVALLVELGRLVLEVSLEEWFSLAAAPATVQLHPILPACAVEMKRLPSSFHRDPADRLIVATARALKLPLATHDQKIIDSGLVSVWQP
jgi:PIN domain nuclease of toxin-antitoxin system